MRMPCWLAAAVLTACGAHPAPSVANAGSRRSPDAIALAERVRAYSGGPEAWAQVDTLAFTFADRRRLFWDRQARKVRIEAVPDGAPWNVLVYDLDAETTTLVEPDVAGATRPDGRVPWTLDTWWLLAPLRVLDPGVRPSIGPARPGDPGGTTRLRLEFDGVDDPGPNDRYVLHVEAATGRIVRWDYQQRPHTPWRSWAFEDERQVGPLRLSLFRRRLGAGGSDVAFAAVLVNTGAPSHVWTSRAKIL